jgi:hypothetical protein
MLLERIDARDEEDVEYVPVIGFLDTVAARELGIVEQIPTLFLRNIAANLVGVDDEAVRAEALGHAEQLLAVVAHRPFIGCPEVRKHLLEIGLELIARQRLDQLCWPHHFARPRIIDVDQVPDIRLASAQPIYHGGPAFHLSAGSQRRLR